MRRTAVLAAAVTVGATLAVLAAAPGGASPAAVPVSTKPLAAASHTALFPVYDAAGTHVRDAAWRITDAGGNCCEVYVAATPTGRLLEFGGAFPAFSDDRGATWHQVVPFWDGGEGAVTAAPNGDLLGVSWDLWTGDRMEAYKYDAATKQWSYAAVPLHQPISDRPWISVVPGPFTLEDGTTVPYASVIRANYLSTLHDTFYLSFDGLTYLPLSGEPVQGTGPFTTGYLEPADHPDLDWVQPHPMARVAPLPRGGFLNVSASRGFPTCPSTKYGADRAWSCLTVPGRRFESNLRVDSRGRLHTVTQPGGGVFRYHLSADGGRTWSHTDLVVPGGGVVLDEKLLDYKVNAVLDRAVVTVHADTGSGAQDVVFRLATAGDAPRLIETMLVGLGDDPTYVGVTAPGRRFDFSSIALMPDGAVAVAFTDSRNEEPLLAVELPGEGRPAPTASPTAAPTASPTALPTVSPSATPLPSESATPAPSPTTPAPTTPAPTTPAPTTPAPTTPAPTTPAPTTPAPTSAPPSPTPSAPPGDTTAPAVSAVLPLRLTHPAVVRFDEPVTGVTPSNVALRLASGPAVTTTATCRNGAAPAACDAVVTQVELRPVAPLRPGERYVLAVDGPRDAAGNAAVPVTFGFRASTVEDQGSVAAAYAWRTVPSRDALGGSYAVERRAGARLTYAFTGTSVTWYGAAGPDQGRVEVLVDGVRRATVDTYAATRRWRVARTIGGLSPGAHTLTLRVAGTRSSRATGTNVIVDDVRAVTVGAPVAAWSQVAGAALAGGSAAVADLAGAQVTFTFRGTGVDWVTTLAPDAGRAAVYVDGRLHATYDNYAATRRSGVRRAVTGLPDGVHRVTVRALGTRSARSAGTLVTVDQWLVR